MATSTFHLQPPQLEDSMDVSSPANRAYDDDVDLDLDLDDDVPMAPQAQDDENMIDDADQHPDGLVDDIMQDDQAEHHPPIAGTYASLDEDLIDYSDDEYLYTQGKEADPSTTDAPQPPTQLELEPRTESQTAVPSQNETSEHQKPEAPVLAIPDDAAENESLLNYEHDGEHNEEHDEEQADGVHNEEHDDEEADGVHNDDKLTTAQDMPETALQYEKEQSESDQHADKQVHGEVVEDGDHKSPKNHGNLDQSTSIPAKLDTAAAAPVGLEGPPTPTDTGLHPIVFYYEDQVYPLFRSKSSPNGLIKDDNLVSVSLGDFIKHCRQRLVIKTSNDIDERFELLLTFENLHLSVVEDSAASFQTSLKEVLDVYVELHENDLVPTEEIPPLEISCSLQVKFNSSIVAMQNAAAIGKGISELLGSEATYDESGSIQHEQTNDVDDSQDGYDAAEHEADDSYGNANGVENDEHRAGQGDEQYAEAQHEGATSVHHSEDENGQDDDQHYAEAIVESTQEPRDEVNGESVRKEDSERYRADQGHDSLVADQDADAADQAIQNGVQKPDSMQEHGEQERAVVRTHDDVDTNEKISAEERLQTHAVRDQTSKTDESVTDNGVSLLSVAPSAEDTQSASIPAPFDDLIDYSDDELDLSRPQDQAKLGDKKDEFDLDFTDDETAPVTRVTPTKRARDTSADNEENTDAKKLRSS